MAHKIMKILLVLVITVLIWVWADLALDKQDVETAIIKIAKSTEQLWVSFDDYSSFRNIKMTLKGPASKIDRLKRQLEAGKENLEIFFDAEARNYSKPDTYNISLLQFLKGSDKIKKLGLSVESCEPENLKIRVQQLVEKKLIVKCIDKDNLALEAEIDPAQINMFVPPDWAGEKQKAYVSLTEQQIAQARVAPITEEPYIDLAPGQRRYATSKVTIKLPPYPRPISDLFSVKV